MGEHRSGVLTNEVSKSFPTTVTVEAMECLPDLSKVEILNYKATGHEASTEELVWSGHCLYTKGQALECDCFREELLHVSDEVSWGMR